MPYTRLPESFTDLSWDLSGDAYRVHVAALIYSNRVLTNGRIPRSAVRGLAPKAARGVAELLRNGWWKDDGDAYQVVHTMEHQEAAETVQKRLADARARAQKRRDEHAEGTTQ